MKQPVKSVQKQEEKEQRQLTAKGGKIQQIQQMPKVTIKKRTLLKLPIPNRYSLIILQKRKHIRKRQERKKSLNPRKYNMQNLYA